MEANDRRPITIDRYDNAALMHDQELRFEATYGELRVQTGTFSGEPEVRLLLKNVRVSDPILDNPPNEKDEHEFAAMGWPDVAAPRIGIGWIDTPLGLMVAAADRTHLHLLEFTDRKALRGELRKLAGMVKGDIGFGVFDLITGQAL